MEDTAVIAPTIPAEKSPENNIASPNVSKQSSPSASPQELDSEFLKHQAREVTIPQVSPSVFLDHESPRKRKDNPKSQWCPVHGHGDCHANFEEVYAPAMARFPIHAAGVHHQPVHQFQIDCLENQITEMKREQNEVNNVRMTVLATLGGVAALGLAGLSTLHMVTGIYRNLRG